MKHDLCKNVRAFQKWAVTLSILAGVGVLTLCFASAGTRVQEPHGRLMLPMCLFFVCLSSIAAVCCGISWSLRGGRPVSRTRAWIVRIFFYSLFLTGPTLLSWGHVFYVRAKLHDQEKAKTVSVEGLSHNPYVGYSAVCDCLGVVIAVSWVLWLWCIVVAKSTQHAFAFYLRHTGSVQSAKRNSNTAKQG